MAAMLPPFAKTLHSATQCWRSHRFLLVGQRCSDFLGRNGRSEMHHETLDDVLHCCGPQCFLKAIRCKPDNLSRTGLVMWLKHSQAANDSNRLLLLSFREPMRLAMFASPAYLAKLPLEMAFTVNALWQFNTVTTRTSGLESISGIKNHFSFLSYLATKSCWMNTHLVSKAMPMILPSSLLNATPGLAKRSNEHCLSPYSW